MLLPLLRGSFAWFPCGCWVSVVLDRWDSISNIREEEVSDDQEERRACHEDIVVVLADVGKCTGSRLGDWFGVMY